MFAFSKMREKEIKKKKQAGRRRIEGALLPE